MQRSRIRATDHESLHSAQLFRLFPCYLLEGFFDFVKGPFRGLFLQLPKCFHVFFTISTFQGSEALLHHFSVQQLSSRHLTSSKYSLAGDSSCHWPCIPACVFFFSLFSKPLYSLSFLAKVFPHSSHILIFSHHHPKPSTVRLLLERALSTANLSVFFFSPYPCNISGIYWSCMNSEHPVSPPTPTARSKVFFALH